MPDPRELAAIFAGGCVGALARAGLVEAVPTEPGHWPWVTLFVNLAGTLALGLFVTRLQERLPPTTYRRPLLCTGFCGALTTFSTFGYETVRLTEEGETATALTNVVLSLAAGLAAAAAGWALGTGL